MTPTTRPSTEEQPPPYAQDAHPLEDLRAQADVEELPEYTPPKPLPDRVKPSWKERLRRKWYIIPVVILVVIAAIVGGVIGNNQWKHQTTVIKDPPSPIITALTATECNAGTFVFYQTNASDLFVYGRLWDTYWNHTNSPQVPVMKLDLSETELRPMYGTNLTAVAYTSINESLDEDIIVLRLFYLSFDLPTVDMAIVEASFNIPYNPNSLHYATAPIPVVQQIVANVSNPASIAACYREYWGLELFYLDSPSSSGKSNTTPATVTQLSFNETGVWANQSVPLNATAYNSGAPLTVSCTANPNVPFEMHLLYLNEANSLAAVTFSNNTWDYLYANGMSSNSGNDPSITAISNMVAVFPYPRISGVIAFYLYYLFDNRPQQASIEINENPGFNKVSGLTASSVELPDGIQAPALSKSLPSNSTGFVSLPSKSSANAGTRTVAATSRMNASGIIPQQSIFYVWRSEETKTYNGVQGSVILNMTNWPPNEQSWVQDSLTVTNFGLVEGG